MEDSISLAQKIVVVAIFCGIFSLIVYSLTNV